MASYKLEIEIA